MLRFTPNFAIEQHRGCAAETARLTSISVGFTPKTFFNNARSQPRGQVYSLLSGDEVLPGSCLHYDGLGSSFTSISSCSILPSLPRAFAVYVRMVSCSAE